MATGPQQFGDVITSDATLTLFNVDEGDIGNWRAVIDGTYCHNTGLEDGTPEPSEVNVILDDRDGPEATYDSYQEARYTIGIQVPSHQREVEEALLAGSAVFEDQAAANLSNVVGDPTAVPIDPRTGEEYYLLKLTGVADPYSFSVERVGFMLIETTPIMMCVYDEASGTMFDVTTPAVPGPGIDATLTVSNRHKGTTEITAALLDAMVPPIVPYVYDPTTDYYVELSGLPGVRNRVDYVDEDLEEGDLCIIVSLAYQWGQMPNASDYQILSRLSRAKRQQLALYRPLGNSTTSRIWTKKLYPDVRLIRPPAEPTSTGQNAVNTKLYEYEVRRLRHPNAQSDFCIEQKVTYPA